MQEAELPTEGLISIIDDDEDFREAIAGLDEDAVFGCVSSALERAKPDEYRS